MPIEFRPATRGNTSVLIGLAGPSGSGKTYSALSMASGMGSNVFMIDTESGRGLHYADLFQFRHATLAPPFRPAAYLEAISAAKDAGADVIIVDSQSHEHEGPGGILQWHEEELQRMAGDDWKKRERVKFTAWIKPKAEHTKFVNGVLQLNVNVIFCFRAKPKLGMVKGDKGQTEVVDLGFQPICSDRFEFEMTSLLMLPPNGQGVPDLEHPSTKLQEQHKPMFPAGQAISRETGERIARWAQGGEGGAEKAPRPATHVPAKQKTPPAASDSASEVSRIMQYLGGAGVDDSMVLRYFGVDALDQLSAGQVGVLRSKAKLHRNGTQTDVNVLFDPEVPFD